VLAAIDGAADTLGGSKNLLGGTGQGLGERLWSHLTGNVDDLVKSDVARVFDVLLLLPVARRLLESLDDKGGGSGNNVDFGLSVLDRKLDGHSQTLPGTGSLGDIFTDLLR